MAGPTGLAAIVGGEDACILDAKRKHKRKRETRDFMRPRRTEVHKFLMLTHFAQLLYLFLSPWLFHVFV